MTTQMLSQATTTTSPLDDNLKTRFKLAAAWTSAMFLYAYADIINFVLEPGALEEILTGEIGGMTINGTSLLGAAAWMTCASLMIAACAVLSPRWCRRVNIGYGGLSTIVIPLLALTSETWGYYYLFNFFEVVLTAYVVWVAINWPAQSHVPEAELLTEGDR